MSNVVSFLTIDTSIEELFELTRPRHALSRRLIETGVPNAGPFALSSLMPYITWPSAADGGVSDSTCNDNANNADTARNDHERVREGDKSCKGRKPLWRSNGYCTRTIHSFWAILDEWLVHLGNLFLHQSSLNNGMQDVKKHHNEEANE